MNIFIEKELHSLIQCMLEADRLLRQKDFDTVPSDVLYKLAFSAVQEGKKQEYFSKQRGEKNDR